MLDTRRTDVDLLENSTAVKYEQSKDSASTPSQSDSHLLRKHTLLLATTQAQWSNSHKKVIRQHDGITEKNVQHNRGNMYKNPAVKITTGETENRRNEHSNNQKHS